MIYAVTYELRTKDKDYSPFYSFLEKQMGDSAMHVLRDSWWIYSQEPMNVIEMRENIKQFLSEQDLFYISELSAGVLNGWMAVSVWDWYKEYSNK